MWFQYSKAVIGVWTNKRAEKQTYQSFLFCFDKETEGQTNYFMRFAKYTVHSALPGHFACNYRRTEIYVRSLILITNKCIQHKAP